MLTLLFKNKQSISYHRRTSGWVEEDREKQEQYEAELRHFQSHLRSCNVMYKLEGPLNLYTPAVH